eukprot:GCRY01000464.1.p1 GENE.GCRY01000464.1~~GCRY01000464.1.p1  ORF type:complete len:464 (-),score=119.91 GCRY01000464.1:93-1484(-)
MSMLFKSLLTKTVGSITGKSAVPALLKRNYLIPRVGFEPPKMSAADAASLIQSNQSVYVHMGGATPNTLLNAMSAQSDRLRNVEVMHLHTEGPAKYLEPSKQEAFRGNNFFIASNAREAVNSNRADFTPMFFYEVPDFFRKHNKPVDVALIHVTPPDRHGYCSLGITVSAVLGALEKAPLVIAQVNPNMPRVHGEGQIHISAIDAVVEVDDPLPAHMPPTVGPIEKNIGKRVAELIPDGATLQFGIGQIPDAVCAELHNHKNLGIHSELVGTGVLPLLQSGAANNSLKAFDKGKLSGTFLLGSPELYDFVDDNPSVVLRDVAFINNPRQLCRNPKVHAINACIEVDITGQVVSTSIGRRMYSGIGGQMDFISGANLCPDGKAIICVPSTTSKGESRISAVLKEGAAVSLTREITRWIVTEYGAVNLYGLTLRERASKLIDIAHPDHRAALEEEAFKRFGKRLF